MKKEAQGRAAPPLIVVSGEGAILTLNENLTGKEAMTGVLRFGREEILKKGPLTGGGSALRQCEKKLQNPRRGTLFRVGLLEVKTHDRKHSTRGGGKEPQGSKKGRPG